MKKRLITGVLLLNLMALTIIMCDGNSHVPDTGKTDAGVRRSVPYVKLFKDSKYRGESIVIYKGHNASDLGRYGFDDCISSVKCYNGAFLEVYKDKDYNGTSLQIASDVPNLRWVDFRDCISSVKVLDRATEVPPFVVLFDAVDYSGRFQVILDDVYYYYLRGVGLVDRGRSMKVFNGAHVLLTSSKDPDKKTDLSQDIPDLAEIGWENQINTVQFIPDDGTPYAILYSDKFWQGICFKISYLFYRYL